MLDTSSTPSVPDDFSGLTLTGSFVGHSQLNATSFRSADLTRSTFCWNDFIAVDFTNARLSHSDMRASTFSDVRFDGAVLNGVDFRHASFDTCSFAGASMIGTVLTRDTVLELTAEQRSVIAWADAPGDKPEFRKPAAKAARLS